MFSKRLKELRIENKIVQSELAKELDISNRTISMYEQGNSEPNIEILVKIAKYFNVTTDYLVGLTDVKRSDVDAAFMSSYLGLSEKAVSHLPFWREASECKAWSKKTLDTVNLLFEPNCNLLENITAYLHFFASHYYNVYDDIDDIKTERFPVSELSFYDQKSGLSYSQDWDMWTNALLVQIINELATIRKENYEEYLKLSKSKNED